MTVPITFAALVVLSFGETALAGTEDGGAPPPETGVASLNVAQNSTCVQSYISELEAAGFKPINIAVNGNLQQLARVVGLPRDAQPQYVLIVGGYVFADHVAPQKIVATLQSKPRIGGLIASNACADVETDADVHAAPLRTLENQSVEAPH
jgi:hypothetical protein